MGTVKNPIMPDEEVFKRHPLPWEHRALMIVDANGKEVIHIGGIQGGERKDAHMLSALNAFIVEAANLRRPEMLSFDPKPNIANIRQETIDYIVRVGWPLRGSVESAFDRGFYVGKQATSIELVAVLKSGADMVESTLSHTSHGGPTREEAQAWTVKARTVLQGKE